MNEKNNIPLAAHLAEVAALRASLEEAEAKLAAMQQDSETQVSSQNESKDGSRDQRAEHNYRLMVEAMNEGAITLAPDGTVIYCNPRFSDMAKASFEEIHGKPIQMFIAAFDPSSLEKLSQGGEVSERELTLRAIDGSTLSIYLSATTLQNVNGETIAIYMVAMDLTELKKTEKALQEAEKKYSTIFENAIEGIFQTTLDGRYLSANPALARIFHYESPEELISLMNIVERPLYVDPSRREDYMRFMHERGCVINFESQAYCKNGDVIWISENARAVYDADGVLQFFEGSVEDITERKRYEAQLEYQASFDELTGLANGHLLRDRLRQAIASADRYGHQVTVAFIDLDQFKFINDSLGHNVGNHLLKTVAQRLKACMREVDTIARLGGDEFVLIIDRSHEAAISLIMPKILEAVSTPISVGDRELHITCSIGCSMFPEDGRDSDTLLKNADAAMYRAKEQGRNNFQSYTKELNEKISNRLSLESNLRQALKRNEFFLDYQPQVDLQTGAIVGVEALIRWRHGATGVVSPAQFIPLAEEIGLIVPIGEWVLRTACAQNKAWQDAGLRKICVSVNLSARQFRQKDLAAMIVQALEETGLPPEYLNLELTESMVMQNVSSAVLTMQELKSMGVRLSIDDFGTGYSSLSCLKRFPIDVLKIDRSFVEDITNDVSGAPIAPSIITLAHSLKLKVIAEGVESAAQLDYLLRHGCDEIQGFYFSRPISVEQCADLIRRGTSITTKAVERLRERQFPFFRSLVSAKNSV